MPLRLAWVCLLFVGMDSGGINWKSVWLEPRTPVILKVGETKPYTVMGLNGADVKADLTKSPYLKITSSDSGVSKSTRRMGRLSGRDRATSTLGFHSAKPQRWSRLSSESRRAPLLIPSMEFGKRGSPGRWGSDQRWCRRSFSLWLPAEMRSPAPSTLRLGPETLLSPMGRLMEIGSLLP